MGLAPKRLCIASSGWRGGEVAVGEGDEGIDGDDVDDSGKKAWGMADARRESAISPVNVSRNSCKPTDQPER